MNPTDGITWRRVHKITPLLETWHVLAALFGLIVIQNIDTATDVLHNLDRHFSALVILLYALGSIALLALLAGAYSLLAWHFRAYAITADSVHEKRGVLLRQHRSARLSRVQTVDIIRPLLGRFIGLGKLRIETAGGSDSRLEVGYLSEKELEAVRNEILARASGVQGAERKTATPEDQTTPAAARQQAPAFKSAPEQILYQVDPKTLIRGLLASGSFLLVVAYLLLMVGLTIAIFAGAFGADLQDAGLAPVTGMLPVVLAFGSWAWNRFAGEFNFTAASSPDGLRIRKGLLETRAQTLPPGRIHAVQLTQPLLWRIWGWWRVSVLVAGYGVEVKSSSIRFDTALLPVGNLDAAKRALWLVMPDLGVDDPDAFLAQMLNGVGPAAGLTCGSPRSRWFNFWTWKRKAVATTNTACFIRDGRFVRTLTVVSHEHSQSHTLHQGPVGRLLNVAGVQLDIVPGEFKARINGLDQHEAATLWWEESRRARVSRHQERPEAWLARVDAASW